MFGHKIPVVLWANVVFRVACAPLIEHAHNAFCGVGQWASGHTLLSQRDGDSEAGYSLPVLYAVSAVQNIAYKCRDGLALAGNHLQVAAQRLLYRENVVIVRPKPLLPIEVRRVAPVQGWWFVVVDDCGFRLAPASATPLTTSDPIVRTRGGEGSLQIFVLPFEFSFGPFPDESGEPSPPSNCSFGPDSLHPELNAVRCDFQT